MTVLPVLASNTQYLRHHATVRPNDIAIIDRGMRITWRKLGYSVIQFTLELRDLGIGPDMLVGLHGADRFTHWLLMMACEILGAASISLGEVELDSRAPVTSRAQVIFSPLPVAGRSSHRVTIEWIAQVMQRPVTAADWDLLDTVPDPQATCRLGRSSGTTGEPKLVAYSFGLDFRLTLRMAEDTGLVRLDRPRFLCVYHFTVRMFDLFVAGCLNLGGTVIFSAPGSALRDITRHVPDVAQMLPVTAEQVLDQIDPRFQKPRRFALVVGGAALSPGLRRRLLDLLVTEVTAVYAANEAGIISMVDEDGLGTIQHDFEVAITDDAGRPVPYGEAGAIRVRSPFMVDGYLNSPELTAERFRDGWFHTGDMGVMPGPGRLRVLGRNDDVINLGGIKQVPDPVEADVLTVAGVREVAVVAAPNAAGITELVAAVVLAPGVAMADIAAAVKTLLNRYTERNRVVVVDALPRTDYGKLRRGAVAEQLGGARE